MVKWENLFDFVMKDMIYDKVTFEMNFTSLGKN